MRKRIIVILLALGLIPMIMLIPIWAIAYIFIGRFPLANYMNYLMDFSLSTD